MRYSDSYSDDYSHILFIGINSHTKILRDMELLSNMFLGEMRNGLLTKEELDLFPDYYTYNPDYEYKFAVCLDDPRLYSSEIDHLISKNTLIIDINSDPEIINWWKSKATFNKLAEFKTRIIVNANIHALYSSLVASLLDDDGHHLPSYHSERIAGDVKLIKSVMSTGSLVTSGLSNAEYYQQFSGNLEYRALMNNWIETPIQVDSNNLVMISDGDASFIREAKYWRLLRKFFINFKPNEQTFFGLYNKTQSFQDSYYTSNLRYGHSSRSICHIDIVLERDISNHGGKITSVQKRISNTISFDATSVGEFELDTIACGIVCTFALMVPEIRYSSREVQKAVRAFESQPLINASDIGFGVFANIAAEKKNFSKIKGPLLQLLV